MPYTPKQEAILEFLQTTNPARETSRTVRLEQDAVVAEQTAILQFPGGKKSRGKRPDAFLVECDGDVRRI